MRLWHQALIDKLPRQQLLGQHRECAALRGKGWGKPHSVVNYVFEHSPYKLYAYHRLIMELTKLAKSKLSHWALLFMRSMTRLIWLSAWLICELRVLN